jgi:DNA primase
VPAPLADNVTTAIKRAVNIVDLIGEHIALTRRGRTFKGLCPFHDDHNPSFDVDPERQSYRCWSCNAKGDIFDFVMNRERVDFRIALETLAQRARITLPTRRRQSGENRDDLFEIMQWVEGEYCRCLSSEAGQSGRQYVDQRGINGASVQAFRLGFAPNEWEWLVQRARARRITPEQLERCGLVVRRPKGPGFYDKFRGRLMFPIRDARGRTIAFGGRILPQFESPETPKYMNSPETRIFTKGEHLYGLDRARDAITKGGCAVVVEGYTDCIMPHQHGVTNVVGSLGTAFGDGQVAILKRYADRIILVFDGDEAGQKAADRALGLFLRHEVDLRVLSLPEQLDPCEFLLERGGDEFRRLLNTAADALEFKLQRAGQLFDVTSIAGRRQALDFVLDAVGAIPVLSSGTQPITREIVLDSLARRLSIPPETVRKRLREVREQNLRRTTKRAPAAEATTDPAVSLWQGESPAERELMEIVLAEPGFIDQILERVSADVFRTPGLRRIFEACVALVRESHGFDLDSLRLVLEDRELACRASTLAETGREKGQVERRLGDVLEHLAGRLTPEPKPTASRGESHGNDQEDETRRLAQRFEEARARQRKTPRRAAV